MSLEEKRNSDADQETLRRAQCWGAFCGVAHGSILAPILLLVAWLALSPRATHTLVVAFDTPESYEVVRAEIDRWPLTPRLVGTAGIEYMSESRNFGSNRLALEFRPVGGSRILRFETDLPGGNCAVVVHVHPEGIRASGCLRAMHG
jgi:hypothetical protein